MASLPEFFNTTIPVRFIIVFAISLSQYSEVLGQSRQTDSLYKIAASASGITQVDVLNQLAYRWWFRNYDSCKQCATRAKRIALTLNYLQGQAEANIYLGIYEGQISGNRHASLELFRLAIKQAQKAKNSGLVGFALTQTGNIYRNEGHFDSAAFFYYSSYETLKDSLNPLHLAMLYRNRGKYFGLINDSKSEIEDLQRAWRIRRRLPDPAIKVDALISMSTWYVNQFNSEKARELLDSAEAFCPAIGPSWVVSDYKAQRAMFLFQLGRTAEALPWFQEAKEYYSKSSLPSYVKLLLDIGSVFEQTGSYESGLKTYSEGLEIASKHGYSNDVAKLLLGIGNIYHALGRESIAESYANQVITLAQKNGYAKEEAKGFNLYGNILVNLNQYQDALVKHRQALTLRIRLNDRRGQAASLYNIGEAYEYSNNLQGALDYQLQSLEMEESILNKSGMVVSYAGLGRLYMKLGELTNASSFLEKGEILALHIHANVPMLEIYQLRKELFARQGDYKKAYQYANTYDHLRDSIYNTSLKTQIANLEGLYKLDQKEKEIQLLTIDKKSQQDQIIIQNDRIRQQRLILLAVVVGLFFVLALAYNQYRFRRKVSRLNIEIQNRSEEIQAQSEKITQTNAALNIINRELSEKNEEILTQSEEITETNSTLLERNSELARSQKMLAAQSQELEAANTNLRELNMELAQKQEELEAQSEELRESNQVISSLNENLENKVQERTRKLEQAYLELDTFFYRSSHDFRRPLTTFMGLAEVAKITVKDANALDLFDKVKETAVNLDRMLIKLQSISDIGSEQLVVKPVNIDEIFKNAFYIYKDALTSMGAKVSRKAEPVDSFYSYPAFINIIITNLLENAIQFSKRVDPSINLEAEGKDGGIEITVTDNGMGVKDEFKSHVFEMFFRASEHSKGNGLGLYIVKKAVEKLQGYISFESTFNLGTTVKIWLPSQKSI